MNGARVYCGNGGITRSNLRPSVGPIFQSSSPSTALLRRNPQTGYRRAPSAADALE